jgi:hypothetical protein
MRKRLRVERQEKAMYMEGVLITEACRVAGCPVVARGKWEASMEKAMAADHHRIPARRTNPKTIRSLINS